MYVGNKTIVKVVNIRLGTGFVIAAKSTTVLGQRQESPNTRVHLVMQSTGLCNFRVRASYFFLLRAYYRVLYVPILYILYTL